MKSTKKASNAGKFYPSDKTELKNLIETFAIESTPFQSRAVIVPHAGYAYSGKLAAKGIQTLIQDAENIFLISPAHFERIVGCTVPAYSYFETPLGKVKVNTNIVKDLISLGMCENCNNAFEHEHSIEVQLPLIKTFFPNAKIVPIIYGCENYKTISALIKYFWADEKNVFVISSDLSHYYPAKEAIKIDNYTANLIENNEIKNFEMDMACGAVGICGLADFAKEQNYTLIRNGLTNSGETTGDTSRVVGYGTWFLYEGYKNSFIKKYYSDLVLSICKRSIESGLHLGSSLPETYPEVFYERGACFVTLQIHGNLRGCIGSVIAHRALVIDLIKNAHAAAFTDPRFNSLTLNEFANVEIEVSLLSKPEQIYFKDENELLRQIEPYKDGIIIRDGSRQGVYLPDVWAALPEKNKFLQSLKLKAGIDKNKSFENINVFKFSSTKISQ